MVGSVWVFWERGRGDVAWDGREGVVMVCCYR